MTYLQIFSDLHRDVAQARVIRIAKHVDIVVVPGDVCEGIAEAMYFLKEAVPSEVPIVFVPGNHEFYGRFHDEELKAARETARRLDVCFLSDDVAIIRGIRFVGATGWTDYRVFGDNCAPAAMAAAREGMKDHRRIGWRRKPWQRFRPQEAASLHATSRSFIARTIAEPFDGPTVVVTHMAPSIRSVPSKWKDDLLTAAFASSIADDLLSGDEAATPRVDAWIHGHVHACADHRIGNCRVVCNPHGYGVQEIPDFDPTFVLEIR